MLGYEGWRAGGVTYFRESLLLRDPLSTLRRGVQGPCERGREQRPVTKASLLAAGTQCTECYLPVVVVRSHARGGGGVVRGPGRVRPGHGQPGPQPRGRPPAARPRPWRRPGVCGRWRGRRGRTVALGAAACPQFDAVRTVGEHDEPASGRPGPAYCMLLLLTG